MPIDKVGLFLLVVGVGALQILLDKGNDLDWFESQVIVVLAVVAVACLAVLVVELTDRHPVVDLHLFAERNFLVGTIILSIGYLVFFGNVVILPLWLQTNMGYTATWAGLAAAPIGLLPVILSAVVGKNMHRIDLRIWASFSFAVFAAVSFWNSHFNTDVTFAQIVLPRLLMGAGVATFFVPLTALTLSGIPDSLLPSATGLSNFHASSPAASVPRSASPSGTGARVTTTACSPRMSRPSIRTSPRRSGRSPRRRPTRPCSTASSASSPSCSPPTISSGCRALSFFH